MSSGRFGNIESRVALAHQILVVEDEADTSAFLTELLERNGYKVTVAKEGGQAHSAFIRHRPDFVILDLILPGESGFEICERMKAADEQVPVLILSAIEMDDARSLAQRVGADGYLTKPFDPNELLENIVAISEVVWERTHSARQPSGDRIRFNCRCGKKFKVSKSHRGKSLTCPECGEPLIVPTHN